jgi:hypothetical protein
MGEAVVEAGLLGPGIMRRGARRIHRTLPRLGWRERALLFALVSWVPLAILTMIEGHFAGQGWVFMRDLGAYARFLLAGPLLVAIEPCVDQQLLSTVSGWTTSALVPGDRGAVYGHFLDRLAAWRRSYRPEVVLLLLAYALTLIGVAAKAEKHDQPWLFGGDAPGPLSWAGWWWVIVSGPLFIHTGLRWLWRFVLWTSALFRLAVLPARIHGTHADCMGGLLGAVKHHHLFAVVPLSVSLVAAGAGANAIFFRGVTVGALRHTEIFIVALELIIFVGPLVVFTPLMVAARRKAAARFGAVAAHHADHLEEQIDTSLQVDQRTRPRLPLALLQSEGGLAQTFGSVLDMRSFPATKESLLMFAAACVAPLLLLELTAVPARELFERLRGLLL